MANNDSSNQLNLTVVALVALVAIVGLVALVMNAMSIKSVQFATGSQQVSAKNLGGKATEYDSSIDTIYNNGGVRAPGQTWSMPGSGGGDKTDPWGGATNNNPGYRDLGNPFGKSGGTSGVGKSCGSGNTQCMNYGLQCCGSDAPTGKRNTCQSSCQ